MNSPSTGAELVHLEDILAARSVIESALHRSPLVGSQTLSRQTGLEVHLKLEMFQKTGSFKTRGVLNRLSHLDVEAREKGVISLSAGNHAQALAWAASSRGIASTVVMPESSVSSKVDAARAYGASVVLTSGNLLETCLQLRDDRGLTLVHPFDDEFIIAGHGTVGLEILEDLPEVEAVIVGIGGGGLISGVAAAVKGRDPGIRLIGVEPEGAPTMTRSLQKGEPVHLDRMDTIADGLAAPFVGVKNLHHVQALVDEVVTVSDRLIAIAMKLLLARCKVLAEPAAASSVAALLGGKVILRPGAPVACLLSGGNVDLAMLGELLRNPDFPGKANEETA